MNPASLLQAPYQSLDYALNNDNKYIGHERSFTHATTYSPNDFPFLSSRRPLSNGLNTRELNQTLSVPTNSGLEYNSQPPISDHSYDNGGHLPLSPPSSIDGITNNLQPVSNFSFGIPKLTTSNASSSDHFSSSVAQYTHPSWSDTAMTEIRQSRPPILQPQVSPQSNYVPFNGISTHIASPSRVMQQFSGPYSTYSRPYNGTDMQHGLYGHHPRSSPFNLPAPMSMSMPASYGSNGSYGSMQPQAQIRSDGPPFDDTKVLHNLVSARSHTLQPDISANIQKGFFQVDGKWTCYRRNYFTVSCAFSFKNAIADGNVYLQRHSSTELVQQYAVSISAKTGNGTNQQESETRQLVQHTPKRDKATESVPGRHVVQPATHQSLQSHGNLSGAPIYSGGQHVSPGMMSNYAGFASPGHLSPATSHTFERIQFQKATANNGKRRAQQQYFHVVVELSVNVGRPGAEDNWVVVATRQSHAMVVRGRSPGHYKDNMRRDGQTHRDSDHGSGSGGDGGGCTLPMPPYVGGSQTSSMDWTSPHRPNQHYGGSYSRSTYETGYSPQSASSSTSLTNSPTESVLQVSELNRSTTGPRYESERPVLMAISGSNKEMAAGHDYAGYSGRKRRYLDDDTGSEHEYYGSTIYSEENISPRSFDFTGTRGMTPLCAS